MSGSIVGDGTGVLSGMSIPGMSGSIVGDGTGVLPDMFIPDMADDVGRKVVMTTPKAALATATRTTHIRIRRVHVQLVM